MMYGDDVLVLESGVWYDLRDGVYGALPGKE